MCERQNVYRFLVKNSSERSEQCAHHWACRMEGGQRRNGVLCNSPECTNLGTLRCPTCINLKLPDAYFCSQVTCHPAARNHFSSTDLFVHREGLLCLLLAPGYRFISNSWDWYVPVTFSGTEEGINGQEIGHYNLAEWVGWVCGTVYELSFLSSARLILFEGELAKSVCFYKVFQGKAKRNLRFPSASPIIKTFLNDPLMHLAIHFPQCFE